MEGIAVGMGAGNGWHAAIAKIAHSQVNFLSEFMETL